MMTRKDYVRTAEILNYKLYTLGVSSPEVKEAIEEIADDFAEYFAEDNERFNLDMFMSAVRR